MGTLPNAQGHRRDLQHENKSTTDNTAYLEGSMFTASLHLPTSQTIAKHYLNMMRVGKSEKTIACLCTPSHKNNQN